MINFEWICCNNGALQHLYSHINSSTVISPRPCTVSIVKCGHGDSWWIYRAKLRTAEFCQFDPTQGILLIRSCAGYLQHWHITWHILVSFCIVERAFIQEAPDTASLKSSRRVLCDRASFSTRKLATPPSKTPFLAGVSVETRTWIIEYAIWLVNLNLPPRSRETVSSVVECPALITSTIASWLRNTSSHHYLWSLLKPFIVPGRIGDSGIPSRGMKEWIYVTTLPLMPHWLLTVMYVCGYIQHRYSTPPKAWSLSHFTLCHVKPLVHFLFYLFVKNKIMMIALIIY